ncbi:MAG: hypothetical protein N2C12_12405 [Planctomycetales bacterium]
MNLVGKIFVFLVFAMSLVFMAFSVMVFSMHKNWKEEVMRTDPGGADMKVGWRMRYDTVTKLNIALRHQKTDLKDRIAAQKASERQAIAKLEAELQRELENGKSLEVTYQAEAAKLSASVTELQNQQTNLENLRAENESLRDEIAAANGTIDQIFAESAKAQEMLHQMTGETIRLEERSKQLTGQLAQAERVLAANELTVDTPIDGIERPLAGVITRVKKDKDNIFVEITVGSDDGLLRGQRMEVFRGGDYLGQIEIIRTETDRSVGRVDPKKHVGKIKVRDNVATRRDLNVAG